VLRGSTIKAVQYPVRPSVAACPLPSSNTTVEITPRLQELGTNHGSGGMVVDGTHSTNMVAPRPRSFMDVLPG